MIFDVIELKKLVEDLAQAINEIELQAKLLGMIENMTVVNLAMHPNGKVWVKEFAQERMTTSSPLSV